MSSNAGEAIRAFELVSMFRPNKKEDDRLHAEAEASDGKNAGETGDTASVKKILAASE
ncbi:hypothetical protein [Streptomyces sp. NPDC052042]|uniref:hypothetical protein n=1 Tax=Streptomyces sp. NPDC052042 TaxID=3365683 RepID=UPI0037CF38B5